MITLCSILLSSVALADAPANLAASGDAFWFDARALDDASNVQNVEWSQGARKHAEAYVQVIGIFSEAPKATEAPPFMLFLQKDMVDAFREQHCDERRCQATITAQYQYGQDKDQTMRFVVYHNPANKPYQHRFLATNAAATYTRSMQTIADTASELKLPIPGAAQVTSTVSQITTVGQNIVGDYLHTF